MKRIILMLLMLSVYLVCLGCGSKAENILTQHNSVDGDVTSIEIAAPYEYTWKYVPMNELAEIDPVAAQCDSRLDTSKNDYGIKFTQLTRVRFDDNTLNFLDSNTQKAVLNNYYEMYASSLLIPLKSMNNVSNIKTERKDAIVSGKSGIEIYCSFTDMQKDIDEVFHYLIIKNEKEFWTLITCYSKNDTKAKNCVDQIYKNVKIKDKK